MRNKCHISRLALELLKCDFSKSGFDSVSVSEVYLKNCMQTQFLGEAEG